MAVTTTPFVEGHRVEQCLGIVAGAKVDHEILTNGMMLVLCTGTAVNLQKV